MSVELSGNLGYTAEELEELRRRPIRCDNCSKTAADMGLSKLRICAACSSAPYCSGELGLPFLRADLTEMQWNASANTGRHTKSTGTVSVLIFFYMLAILLTMKLEQQKSDEWRVRA